MPSRKLLLLIVLVSLVLGAPALGATLRAGAPAGALSAEGELPDPDPTCSTDYARRYVAGGDGVVHPAKDTDEAKGAKTDRYPDVLLKKLQEKHPGPWCEFNTMDEATSGSDMTVTSQEYMTSGNPTQQSMAHELRPHLITLTLGRDNNGILDHVDRCMTNVRDHDFLQANTCALFVLNNPLHWETLTKELSTILERYRTQQTGNPDLVVAVTGYFNPYPSALEVVPRFTQLCINTVDTIPSCLVRWAQLPSALVVLDQVVRKLNATIEGVVDQFEQTSRGRFFFVNPYEKFKSHCMTFSVRITINVYHPPSSTDVHNSSQDIGCSNTWIEDDGDIGTKSPTYLVPAVNGVLISWLQVTQKLGLYPNAAGHRCLAGLVYEAKTADGLLLKNELGIPEGAKDPEGC